MCSLFFLSLNFVLVVRERQRGINATFPSRNVRIRLAFLPHAFYFIPSFYLHGTKLPGTLLRLPQDTFAPFMDRIEHGLGEDSTLCQVRCFKWQEYAQTTLSFRTILQPRANYKHVECLKHATERSYRVRLAMLLTHSLFLFASTRTPMRTERNPLPAFGILLLSLSFSRIVSHY